MKVTLKEFLEDFVYDGEHLHVVGAYVSPGTVEDAVDGLKNYHFRTTAADILSTEMQDGLFLLDCPVLLVSTDVKKLDDFLCQTVLCIVVIVPGDWVPTGC